MGKKASKAEELMRTKTVAEWIVQGYSNSDILRNIALKWDLKKRQSENYIAKARVLIREEVIKDIADARAFYLKSNLDRYRDLMKLRRPYLSKTTLTKDEFKRFCLLEDRILKIQQDSAKVNGLYVQKIEHTGKDGKDLFTSLTHEELEEENARLNELLESKT